MPVAFAVARSLDAGLDVIGEALEMTTAAGERIWEPELHRFKGELLLARFARDRASEAEKCFEEALSVARRQQAKLWELRAATSLARLWCSQNKRLVAHDLLVPVYDWFTEGFETPVLREAQALLGELA